MSVRHYRDILAAAYSWASVEPGRAAPVLRRVQRCEPLTDLPPPDRWKRGVDGAAQADAWLASRVAAAGVHEGAEPDLAILAALAHDWAEGCRIALLYGGET